MPDLVVRMKKKTDGSAALTCVRADGSTTWQRQDGRLGAFFPLHDLTHFALESVLGFRRAFYGLLAEGWDLSDFGRKDGARPIPEEAHVAEVLVGFLDLERATGERGTAEDFNAKLTSYFSDKNLPVPEFRITDQQLGRIRERREELFARWRAVPPGGMLELEYG